MFQVLEIKLKAKVSLRQMRHNTDDAGILYLISWGEGVEAKYKLCFILKIML
jgi:hypothetical protein